MKPSHLLDTNICIHIARERPASVVKRFEAMARGSLAISLVTWGELRFGAEKSARRSQVLELLGAFTELVPVLSMDAAAGEEYGRIRAGLERSGTPIGNNDLWIAAHARAAGLVLVTNNEREFQRVPELRIENWI